MIKTIVNLYKKGSKSYDHHNFHKWKFCQIWKILCEISKTELCRCYCSYINQTFLAKSLFQIRLPRLCVMLFPALFQIIVKKMLYISVSSDLYKKYIVTHDYWVLTRYCLSCLEKCEFQLILIGTPVSQILQRVDKYVYICQEIDYFYTFFKHRFISSIVTSSGEVFSQLTRAVQHNLRWKGAKKIA